MPAAPDQPIVCYVTDRKSLGLTAPVESLLEKIRAAAQAGVDWIQIREKDLPARELLALVREAVAIVQSGGGKAVVIVNDRLDVALAAGAAGVHLGGESAPAREVVRWCRAGNAPAGFRIGVSCHSIEETCEAGSAGADYAFFGPIYDTPSKKSYGAPQGIGRLKEVCTAMLIPVIAIGGVNEQNAAECIRAGAAGIAAIRMFQEAKSAQALTEAVAQLHRLV
ncbi:MAG TPA: thiamine phosphate synthase [Candidatus Limnocylindria bacterium]|nr:thiamine phosphate synthase [Candidatus Limnocylindria bacterium]